MKKQIYPRLAALLCLLLCFSVTQAQERLWGVSSSGMLFSMNPDGSDPQSVTGFSAAIYGYNISGFLELSNGEVMVTTEQTTVEEEYGAHSKITAHGLSRLYFIDYVQGYGAGRGLVQGDNGKVYTPSTHVIYAKLDGIVELEPDGSGTGGFGVPSTDYSSEFALTKGENGIYGLSRGDSNNDGFIFKVRSDERRNQIIYQFTGSEGGIRPTGRLVKGENGFLFGTTLRGGLNNNGMFFKIKEDGTQLTKLFDLASKSITKPEADGKYQTLLDLLAEGYRPVTDSEGHYFIFDATGIYKVNTAGFLVSKISTVAADKIDFITPSFQHAVKVSNIADQSTGLPTDLSVQVTAFPGATRYDLQISSTPDFSTILTELSNSEPLFTLSDLDESTTYYVRARPNIWPYYGETVSFTTQGPVDLTKQIIFGQSLQKFYLNKDGSGQPFQFSILLEIGLPVGVLQLSNGEILVVSSPDATSSGRISKVTPSGLVTLYTLNEALDYSYLRDCMVEGNDGYVYSLRFGVMDPRFTGFIRFKIDGSSYERPSASQYALLYGSKLAATSHGIYGISKGFTDNKGFLYRIKNDMSGVDVLYNFQDATGSRSEGKVVEGSDGYLYGAGRDGGAFNAGVLYKIKPDGTQYTIIHNFKTTDGSYPVTGLVTNGSGVLYGTTRLGGMNGKGVIFRINEDGTGFQKLLSFYDVGAINLVSSIVAEISLGDDGYLYGVANTGFYRIKTDGTGFQKLKADANGVKADLIRQPFVPDAAVVSPANQSAMVSLNPTINVKPVTGAATYTLELSETANFSDSITTLTSTEPVFTLSSLEHFTSYYARVRSSLLPYYGETTSFTTLGALVETQGIDQANGRSAVQDEAYADAASTEVSVFPNPSATTFTVKRGSEEIRSLSITDTNGMVVYQSDQVENAPSFQVGEGLKKGIYILRIKGASGEKVIRLVRQ